MKPEKQELILKILSGGKYLINVHDGSVYSRRRAGFKMLMPAISKGGHMQYEIYHDGDHIKVYGHQLVWLSVYGRFSENNKIVHIDGNRLNNGLNNLRKLERYIGIPKEETKGGFRTIRGPEISKIRYMFEMGETNYTEIARQLGLNRQSVRLTVLKIKNGQKLKYEEKN